MKTFVITTTALALSIAVAIGLRTPQPIAAQEAAGEPAMASSSADEAALSALRNSPQARVHFAREAFERQARDFFARAASLGAVERSEQAAALSRLIDQYEANQGLSAAEAVLLRTALVNAGGGDAADQAEQVAAIVDRYQRHAEQRMAAHAQQQHNDPRFRDYKARESQVIDEVQAASGIPAGLTRDQYLRQRLQQERERAYAQ